MRSDTGRIALDEFSNADDSDWSHVADSVIRLGAETFLVVTAYQSETGGTVESGYLASVVLRVDGTPWFLS